MQSSAALNVNAFIIITSIIIIVISISDIIIMLKWEYTALLPLLGVNSTAPYVEITCTAYSKLC